MVIHHDASVAHFAERFSRALQIAEKSGRKPLQPPLLDTLWLCNGNHCYCPAHVSRLPYEFMLSEGFVTS